MAKQVDGPTISDDSISFLQEVKKGKARKFAMICKGTSVVSLVVYKKGNVEKRRKEAKETGKGQFYFGIVDGSGINIRFVLARSDGFDSEPVKTAALRGFLEESADFKCKPYFEIVDSPSLVLDEDDPLVGEFLKLQPLALAACDAHPDRAQEINNLCLQIGTHFDQDQSPEAAQRLEQLKSLLSQLSGTVHPNTAGQPPGTTTTNAPAGTDPSASKPDELGEWKKKLADWLPTIKSAIAAKGPNVKAIVQLLSEANALSKSASDLPQAVVKLTECFQLATPKATASTPNSSEEFNARLKALLPTVKAITDEALKEQAKAIVMQAGALAQKKVFDEANGCLDSLESLLAGNASKQPESSSTSKTPSGRAPSGIVAYTKLLLDWRRAQAQVVSNLSSIGNSLLNRNDVKADPRFEQVKAAVAAMPNLIPAFGEELGDLIDAAMTAGPGPRADESLRNAKVVAARYRSLLKTAVALQRLEQLAAKHTNVEANVYSLLDTALAALEREFEARTAS